MSLKDITTSLTDKITQSNCISHGEMYEDKYSMMSPDIPEDESFLNFDYEKDAAFCVGINEQHHPFYAGIDETDYTISNDAKKAREAFIEYLGLNPDLVDIRVASSRCDNCKKQGLHTSFVECAKKVGKNGNFIFYFVGHGYASRNKCILAPADFNPEDVTTGIFGDDLLQWLNEADCKARNVLFILDCCYSGKLGQILKANKKLRINANLFVMCGCLHCEKIPSVGALEHSIFTYFLLDYLRTHDCRKKFYIHQAMHEISEFCLRLSSLIFIYKENEVIYNSIINPILYTKKYCDDDIQDRDLPQKKPESYIISLLRSLLDTDNKDRPNKIVKTWLQMPLIYKSLKILFSKASKSEGLQNCIVSLLFRSSALLHYECEDDYGKNLLGSRNVLLLIAIHVFMEVNFHFTLESVVVGFRSYISIINKLKIKHSNLENLYQEMADLEEKNVQSPNPTIELGNNDTQSPLEIDKPKLNLNKEEPCEPEVLNSTTPVSLDRKYFSPSQKLEKDSLLEMQDLGESLPSANPLENEQDWERKIEHISKLEKDSTANH